jgi:hypothetical protein
VASLQQGSLVLELGAGKRKTASPLLHPGTYHLLAGRGAARPAGTAHAHTHTHTHTLILQVSRFQLVGSLAWTESTRTTIVVVTLAWTESTHSTTARPCVSLQPRAASIVLCLMEQNMPHQSRHRSPTMHPHPDLHQAKNGRGTYGPRSFPVWGARSTVQSPVQGSKQGCLEDLSLARRSPRCCRPPSAPWCALWRALDCQHRT